MINKSVIKLTFLYKFIHNLGINICINIQPIFLIYKVHMYKGLSVESTLNIGVYKCENNTYFIGVNYTLIFECKKYTNRIMIKCN